MPSGTVTSIEATATLDSGFGIGDTGPFEATLDNRDVFDPDNPYVNSSHWLSCYINATEIPETYLDLIGVSSDVVCNLAIPANMIVWIGNGIPAFQPPFDESALTYDGEFAFIQCSNPAGRAQTGFQVWINTDGEKTPPGDYIFTITFEYNGRWADNHSGLGEPQEPIVLAEPDSLVFTLHVIGDDPVEPPPAEEESPWTRTCLTMTEATMRSTTVPQALARVRKSREWGARDVR